MTDQKTEIVSETVIQSRIFTVRGLQVMVDRDLAELYQVATKILNQSVKRNIERFPDNFRFQLDNKEKTELVTNCDRLKTIKFSTTNPYVFTEQGIAMLSTVLKSDIAIKASIQIMQAFVEMRRVLLGNAQILQRLDKIEHKQQATDTKLDQVFEAIEAKGIKPSQGIFYDGQVFDAYTLVADIIRSADKSILLIDNYVDDTVLQLLTKRKEGVSVRIHTKNKSKILKQDLQKHNAQYPPIEIKSLKTAHDRFIILDHKTVFHIGASLKDLGKKWFAFSKIEIDAQEIISKL